MVRVLCRFDINLVQTVAPGWRQIESEMALDLITIPAVSALLAPGPSWLSLPSRQRAFLFPSILFSLRFASTYFTIMNHSFRLPRGGAHWVTSCCSLGWSEKHKSWKMQKVGVDSEPRHSTDFRTIFGIRIG